MGDKYRLVPSDKPGLYRIEALISIPGIFGSPVGCLGGYVSGYHNLSQRGECWISPCATVLEEATVTGNAVVFDHALVTNTASVRDWAFISGEAVVSGSAEVRDRASVGGRARVYGKATVLDSAEVSATSVVRGSASIGGDVFVSGDTILPQDAFIRSNRDFISLFAGHGGITAFRTAGGTVKVKAGCQCFELTTPLSQLIELAEDEGWTLDVPVLRSMLCSYFGVEGQDD